MKNLILIITFLLFGLSVFSQTNLSHAVDFEAVDIDGEPVHLFQILEEGNYVYINFFKVNCSIDQEHVGQSEAAFNYFGCNSGDVFFLGVNTGNNKSEVTDYVIANNINYPVISGIDGETVSTIFEDYNVRASPTFILIAPDDSILEQNIWPVESAENIIAVLEGYGLSETVCTVGIDEVDNAEITFGFYPNPAKSNIELLVNISNFNHVALRIQNLLGEEILYSRISNTHPSVNIREYPDGIYFISLLINNEIISTKKLVVNH